MEKAAIDIDMGYISEEYFYKKYRTLTERLFWVSHLFINKIRQEKNSGTIYKNFEALYIRIHFKRKPFTLMLLEYFKVCPNFKASSAFFAAHLRTLDKNFWGFFFEVCRYRSLPGKIEYVERDDKPLFRRRIRQFRLFEVAVAAAIILLIVRLEI
ncbi:DUF4760 domain-containing protein [Rhizobium etli]|nr:hypothetical protein [Rhizobium etli]